MRHIDIVGLSLAELSLALIFIILAMFPRSSEQLRSQLTTANGTIRDLNAQLVSARQQIGELKKHQSPSSSENTQPNLRSRALPSCAESKLRSDWLFTAVIRGDDRYDVAGLGIVDLSELLKTFDNDLKDARLHGCVQRVQVRVGDGVSAKDYDLALRHLEEHFYPRKLGVEQ